MEALIVILAIGAIFFVFIYQRQAEERERLARENEIEEQKHIIMESLEIIQNSSNEKTRRSRIGVIQDAAAKIISINKSHEYAKSVLALLPQLEKQIAFDAANDRIEKLFERAKAAKTVNTVKKNISLAVGELEDIFNKGLIDEDEFNRNKKILLKFASDFEHDSYMEKGKRLEFKGQKKRALDAYQDALYTLLNDGIPDDEQTEEIAALQKKIENLAGAKTNSKKDK
ncbi:MAG TPA: hypothetical protein ENK05_11705 [Gammaproteobacteria bacterium]|nr:hypothetical protein [Gammaproteobacteria bacterium]